MSDSVFSTAKKTINTTLNVATEAGEAVGFLANAGRSYAQGVAVRGESHVKVVRIECVLDEMNAIKALAEKAGDNWNEVLTKAGVEL